MFEFLQTFSYLVMTLWFACVWISVFTLSKKHDRNEMFHLSLLGGFTGLLLGPLYTYDWWLPTVMYSHELIEGSYFLSIEDFLFGFFVFGIVSVIYEFVTQKGETKDVLDIRAFFYFIAFMLSVVLLALGAVYVLGIHSAISTTVAALLVCVVILYRRTDLAVPAVLSGLLLSLVSIPGYLIPFLINPNWIENEWMTHNLTGLTMLSIPIEEFLWYFSIGVVVSVLWEYTRGIRFK